MAKKILLLGAGHTHIEVLRSFGCERERQVSLTLVTRSAKTAYSGMLPGFLAGFYSFDDIHIDVEALCRFAGAELRLNEAAGIDLAKQGVMCADGAFVPYDILSIDIGSTPNDRDVPGAHEHAVPVKPIDAFIERFDLVRKLIREKGGHANVCIVGGGAGGVELALAVEKRCRQELQTAGLDPSLPAFSLLTADNEILAGFPRRMRARFRELLAERGIEVFTDAPVACVEAASLLIKSREPLPFDALFWLTQASAPSWLANSGLQLDAAGFVEVKPTLESSSHPGVFAAGDIASLKGFDLPKAGVHAVRQGPVLARNLRCAVRGETLDEYKPQRNMLLLLSTADRYAIGTRNGFTFEGRWVWWWKDWIDRRFMAAYKIDAPAGN